MNTRKSAQPLVAPMEVEVSAIERELEEIWRSFAEAEGGQAVMRSAAFTLIYATRASSDGGMINEMLVELTLRHPSRAILLHLNDETAPRAFRAWVTAYCHRPSPTTAAVYSDFITLEASGQDTSAVVSTLLALFRSGLPTVLAWDNSLPPDHPVLLAIGPDLERVIVSAIPPCAPASSLSSLFKITDALGEKPIVTDIVESFVRPWQIAVAALFDADLSAVQHIHEIRLSYGGGKIPTELLLLAAWLSAILKWTTKRITLHGHSPVVQFGDDHSISFSGSTDPHAPEFVEFVIASAEGERVVRCAEPMGENRLLELMHMQLQVWGRDPLRDESLRRARLWLKELLFS